jgi:hypothetical protein
MSLLGFRLPVPDFSTLSRRGKALGFDHAACKDDGPRSLIIDSTDLKMHHGSGWVEENHGTGRSRKSWRKLHIAMDRDSGEIIASLLTTDQVGDETALPELLADIDDPVARVLADGAYDGRAVFACLIERFGPDLEVIIPPPKSAVPGLNDQRDAHIRNIAETGRMTWQTETGYNDRALIEAQIGRWKAIIGDDLTARTFENQTTETRIAAKILNRMTELGRAKFARA